MVTLRVHLDLLGLSSAQVPRVAGGIAVPFTLPAAFCITSQGFPMATFNYAKPPRRYFQPAGAYKLRFVILQSDLMRAVKLLVKATGRFNSRKTRGVRRGGLQLIGSPGGPRGELAELELTLRRVRMPVWKFQEGYGGNWRRLQIYTYADLGKLFKTLTQLQRRAVS